MLGHRAPCPRGFVIDAVRPGIPRDIAQQVGAGALFPVALGKKFQQPHLFAPGGVGKFHAAIPDFDLADVPQGHGVVSRGLRSAFPVEFIGKGAACDGRIYGDGGEGLISKFLALRLVEAQLRLVLLRLLRRHAMYGHRGAQQGDQPDKQIFHATVALRY